MCFTFIRTLWIIQNYFQMKRSILVGLRIVYPYTACKFIRRYGSRYLFERVTQHHNNRLVTSSSLVQSIHTPIHVHTKISVKKIYRFQYLPLQRLYFIRQFIVLKAKIAGIKMGRNLGKTTRYWKVIWNLITLYKNI